MYIYLLLKRSTQADQTKKSAVTLIYSGIWQKKKKKKTHHDRYSSFHILKILKKKLKCIYLKEKKLILQSSPIFNYYTYKINDLFFFAYFKAKFRNFPYYFELSI